MRDSKPGTAVPGIWRILSEVSDVLTVNASRRSAAPAPANKGSLSERMSSTFGASFGASMISDFGTSFSSDFFGGTAAGSTAGFTDFSGNGAASLSASG